MGATEMVGEKVGTAGATVSRGILLSGGVAAMSGIADLVESSLSTPTTVVNPFSGMDVSSKVDTSMLTNDTPSLMIACGLALRSFD